MPKDQPPKHFLAGLQPSPPPNHIWQDYTDYSIYSADQHHRSVWNKHAHECTQITIASSPASVRAEWLAGNGQRTAKELNGDMVWVVPPGVSHAIQWNRRATLLHLYLSDEFFQNVAPENDKISSHLAPQLLVRDQFLIELARELRAELNAGNGNPLFTRSVATITASHLLRVYSDQPGALVTYRGGLGPTREKRVREYIEANLSSQLSLDDLARVAEVSPNYFISLFRQSVGMTPHKFVVQQRIEHARHLLATSRLSLIEIAYRCGFQDQSQFTTVFRRYLGITPGQYKRQL